MCLKQREVIYCSYEVGSVCVHEFDYILLIPVPGSSEVQRFGNSLPHLTAIEVK